MGKFEIEIQFCLLTLFFFYAIINRVGGDVYENDNGYRQQKGRRFRMRRAYEGGLFFHQNGDDGRVSEGGKHDASHRDG